MSELLTILSRAEPQNDALIAPSYSLTYAQLMSAIEQQRDSFLAQGLRADDVALLPIKNSIPEFICLLALLSLDVPVVLHNPDLPTSVVADLKSDCTVVLTSAGQMSVSRLRPPVPRQPSAPQPAVAILSSGSTGRPKQIWHSESALIASARASNRLLPLHPDDRSLVSLPLYHVGGLGLILRALVAGSALVFGIAADRVEAFMNFRISRASLVPTQLHRLLQQSEDAPDCRVLLGGAPIGDKLLAEARHRGWRLHRSYGLSEMASQVITEVRPDYWQCLDQAEIRLRKGELLVRGSSLFLGYGQLSNIQRPLTDDGFYATADLADFQNHDFAFVGRRDNLFVSGGENVLPESVERILLASGMLEQVIVLPQHSLEWGQQSTAMIEPNSTFSVLAFQAYCRENLAPHERPKRLFRWRQTTALKIQRQQLIALVNAHDLEKICQPQ